MRYNRRTAVRACPPSAQNISDVRKSEGSSILEAKRANFGIGGETEKTNCCYRLLCAWPDFDRFAASSKAQFPPFDAEDKRNPMPELRLRQQASSASRKARPFLLRRGRGDPSTPLLLRPTNHRRCHALGTSPPRTSLKTNRWLGTARHTEKNRGLQNNTAEGRAGSQAREKHIRHVPCALYMSFHARSNPTTYYILARNRRHARKRHLSLANHRKQIRFETNLIKKNGGRKSRKKKHIHKQKHQRHQLKKSESRDHRFSV